MRTLVLDSSVAAKWVLPDEEDSPGALRLLDDVRHQRVAIVAPELFRNEVTSVVARAMRSGRLSDESGDALRRLEDMGILFAASARTPLDTVRVAMELRQSPYDCCYLALALELGCDLYTADRRFIRGTSGVYPCVKDIEDYPGEEYI